MEKMQTKQIGRTVHFFERIDSTNVRAKLEAKQGAEHGTIIAADMQTAGRGRRGRQWSSPAGKNLYFTLILKPDFSPEKASMLTLVMAMAVTRGLAKKLSQWNLEGALGIKWPNDLVMNGKKICGILTEMSVEQSRIDYLVIGVGINVEKQEFEPELVDKATSLEAECGQVISKSELLADIMQAFEEEYEAFLETCDLSGLRERYNYCLVNCGREVRVLDPQGEFSGIARGINECGELLVEQEGGTVTAVYAGEVSVRGIYGYV